MVMTTWESTEGLQIEQTPILIFGRWLCRGILANGEFQRHKTRTYNMIYLFLSARSEVPTMAATDVDVSVVIVNYNTETLLSEAMTALRRAASGYSPQIVIIDNALKDSSVVKNDKGGCQQTPANPLAYFGVLACT